MHIPSMMIRVTTLFFVALVANFAIACDTCLVHKVLPAIPPEEPVVLTQPGIVPVTIACLIGIALLSAVAYGTSRMLAQKEREYTAPRQ